MSPGIHRSGSAATGLRVHFIHGRLVLQEVEPIVPGQRHWQIQGREECNPGQGSDAEMLQLAELILEVMPPTN